MDIYQDSRCLDLEKALYDESVDPIDLPFWFLNHITKKFSENELIGSGGFADVYKGALPNGMVVAVKKLRKIKVLNEEDFQREIDCLIKAKHKNIVRFLGYCSETLHTRKPFEGRFVWADERQMLFCFEYHSKGSLAGFLTEESSGLPWKARYQIIKGICEGVGHLHQQYIIHRDLNPKNILLDDSMVPKIADFGISKLLSENKRWTTTENIVGTRPYMAPEFLRSGTITPETDIYSLGVIIIQILMGCSERTSVDKVLETWTNMFGTSESQSLLQVKLCAEIGIKCMDDNPMNRPDIQDIISSLKEKDDISSTSTGQSVDEVDSMIVSSAQSSQRERSALVRFYQQYRLAKNACKPTRINASKEVAETNSELLSTGLSESEMLDVHPLELCFFKAKKGARCIVNIINRTDRYVTYWIIPQFTDMYRRHIGHSIMEPMSTGASDVIMVDLEQPPLDAGMFNILIIAMVSERDLKALKSSIGKDPKIDGLLKRVEELGGEVHAATLTTAVELLSPERDIAAAMGKCRAVVKGIHKIDVHPTQPWILLCHDKYLSIWDYEKQETIVKIEVPREAGNIYPILARKVMYFSVIFIPRRQWFVAADDCGYIYVYSCITMEEIKVFKAGGSPVVSLAIHPTQPFLLSACADGVIKVWNWENGWACSRQVHLFSDNSTKRWWILVKFNPNDANTFTSRNKAGALKVWSMYPPSAQPITTIEQNYQLRYDHIFTVDGRNHVVIMMRHGLQIWDLQTGTRVRTLYGKGGCTAVACHPTLPLIVVGVKRNSRTLAIHFWNSNNYRKNQWFSLVASPSSTSLHR
ncbi:uncharacterized protein [Miscanthus floridulus]|uniref:uncharacterized protein isoform X2 n=1 Tax=Miscanthus floridulus TaxID=154761 RepID=UPI0034581280